MQIEVKDIPHLLSIEKSAKKKRLMKTKQFTVHAGKSLLSKMIEGSQPVFERENYDAQGNEKQVKATKKRTITRPASTPDGKPETVEVEEPEVEQSFFQKYWWHILVGFMLLQSMAGGGEEGGSEQGGR